MVSTNSGLISLTRFSSCALAGMQTKRLLVGSLSICVHIVRFKKRTIAGTGSIICIVTTAASGFNYAIGDTVGYCRLDGCLTNWTCFAVATALLAK